MNIRNYTEDKVVMWNFVCIIIMHLKKMLCIFSSNIRWNCTQHITTSDINIYKLQYQIPYMKLNFLCVVNGHTVDTFKNNVKLDFSGTWSISKLISLHRVVGLFDKNAMKCI